MCLAVPMKIVAIGADGLALADLDGSRQQVDLSLLDQAAVGDFVIVHAGYAIERLYEQDADERLALFASLAQSRKARTP